MASRDELNENEVLKKSSKVARGKKANLMGFSCVVRIYITYNDVTDSSSDERKIIKERSPKNKKGFTKVISKNVSFKEKKDTKLHQENVKKYRGVRQRKWRR
uniref:Uncharacterized protein n=1 Tax=Solanum lycopersicum TaxID=4081 RepID=A0A3Q7EB12_SOLLC